MFLRLQPLTWRGPQVRPSRLEISTSNPSHASEPGSTGKPATACRAHAMARRRHAHWMMQDFLQEILYSGGDQSASSQSCKGRDIADDTMGDYVLITHGCSRSDLRIAVQAQCRLGRSLRTHIRWSGFRSEKRAQFSATKSFQRDTCAGDRVGRSTCSADHAGG